LQRCPCRRRASLIQAAGRRRSVDLDSFKQVNDEHGHQAGDDLLKAVAEVLQTQVRLEEVLGRYGGDEFAIVARGDVASAVQLGERLCENVRGKTFETCSAAVGVTLSVGVAGYSAGEIATFSGASATMVLLGRADAALYQTKHAGKDGVTRWMAESIPAPPSNRWYAQTNTEPAPSSQGGSDDNQDRS